MHVTSIMRGKMHACVQVVISFGFTSDWLRKRREYFLPSSSLLPYKLRLMNLEIYYAQSVHRSATVLITKYLYSMSNNVNHELLYC